MNVEYEMVASMVRQDDVETPVMAGITADILADEPGRAYGFVTRFFREYGKVPTLEAVLEATRVDLRHCTAADPVEFFVDEVRRRQRSAILAQGLREASDLLTHKPDVTDALARIQQASTECTRLQEMADGEFEDILSADAVTKRIVDYDRRAALQAAGKIDGYATPWKELDEATWGIHQAELWTIVARLGVGKTWLLMLFLWKLFLAGVRCLVVSMEMPPRAIAKRFDSLLCNIPNEDLRKGRMGALVRQGYETTLRSNAGKAPLYVVGSGRVRTVEDIDTLVGQLQPQVVLLDGLYLLDKSADRATWERVSFVQGNLKQITLRRDIGIVATSQFNRTVKKAHKTAGTDALAFADAIGYDADQILALFQDEADRQAREMLIRQLKSREGDLIAIDVRWDLGSNDFSFLSYHDDSIDAGPAQQEESIAITPAATN